MHRILFIFSGLLFLSSCSILNIKTSDNNYYTSQYPDGYYTTLPFRLEQDRILISTFWGDEQKEYILSLDNHAPFSLHDHLMDTTFRFISKINNAITSVTGDKSASVLYKYLNTFRFGTMKVETPLLNAIPLVEIPKHYKMSQSPTDGIFGMPFMNNGIWKIDFENKQLYLAHSIDSFDISDAFWVSDAKFDNFNIIDIPLKNDKGQTFHVHLDLGSNFGIELAGKDFKKLIPQEDIVKSTMQIQHISGITETVIMTSKNQTIKIDNHSINVDLTGDDSYKLHHGLMGVGFLKQFSFIIIDNINKKLYFSNKRIG